MSIIKVELIQEMGNCEECGMEINLAEDGGWMKSSIAKVALNNWTSNFTTLNCKYLYISIIL